MTASLQELATLLGGDVNGNRGVLCPGPGHGAADRSLSATPAKNADGFTVHSFAGDDRQACVDHVKARLDPERRAALTALGSDLPARNSVEEDERRAEYVQYVRGIWSAAGSPFGTQAEIYLWRYRHLDLEPDVGSNVIRFHPECPWKDNLTKRRFQTLAMIAALRDIRTDEIVGVQRTRLSLIGEKLDRRVLGFADGAAVKLDGDADVLGGLAIGEGLETCMTARQLGLRPAWALGSKGQIAKFLVLSGVESLTILAEPDADAEVRECAERWHAAGREVLINRPIAGKDLNDALRGVA